MSHRNVAIRAAAICAISMAFIAGLTACTGGNSAAGKGSATNAASVTAAEDMPEVVIVASRSDSRSASVSPGSADFE